MMDFKPGDKVRSIAMVDGCGPFTYYPPVGTIGTVIYVDDNDCLVEWPEGSVQKRLCSSEEYPATAWYYTKLYLELVE